MVLVPPSVLFYRLSAAARKHNGGGKDCVTPTMYRGRFFPTTDYHSRRNYCWGNLTEATMYLDILVRLWADGTIGSLAAGAVLVIFVGIVAHMGLRD